MKTQKSLFLLLVILFTVSFSNGQNNKIEKQLDQLLSGQFKPTEPGCEILVAKQGKVIYKKAFGSANLEQNIPLHPDMIFKLASITKQFTAVAILQLVQLGKISLQDSVQKFIPDFPFKGNTITIENLLTHSSGIRDYMQIEYAGINMERWDFSPKQLIDSFKNYPLQFVPGTKYSYSNSGYFLLGYIIEKVSGKRYQKYVQENIITPLGLTHTYFDDNGNIIPGRVNGYGREGNGFRNADYWSPTIAYAAGGLLSNTEDLYKWISGLLSYKILNKEWLDKAFTGYKLKDGYTISYGYGWYIEDKGNVKSIEHAGNMNGFVTNEIYYPKQDVFVAILCNREDAPKDALSKEISEIVLGQPLQAGIRISDSLMNSYIGTYALSLDPKRTIVITKEKDHLIAKVSGQDSFDILFQTTTKFQLQNVRNAAAEFVIENGKVSKFIFDQNGQFEWNKIQ
ncbi:MAG TPA: serine hydrolase domain-containing protein [Phnomibacter sp.]|nr:serine hydrolase domain-containing protein [Phnomibacter sp.]